MESRERIIQAALEVFGETGYLGATTRRIAQEAGVNEVTLFRHFGSKEELIREAIQSVMDAVSFAALPEEPVDPEQELAEWSRDQMRHMYETRALIRTCMGECQKYAEFADCAGERPRRVHTELTRYLLSLQRSGLAEQDFDANFAASMLMGALFSDVMGRDFMPELYGYTIEDGVAEYVTLLVRAIGATPRKHAAAEDGHGAS